ncbi:unnamed protein product [Paramecium primaurelia]|uniref:Uncharacterized protein n=1 Tax=Paramecium primaurelia TaxID=5886 RepID=A0A8S1L0M6_PARPR|nr:unnamed protein product [Paramecium primaurelia]
MREGQRLNQSFSYCRSSPDKKGSRHNKVISDAYRKFLATYQQLSMLGSQYKYSHNTLMPYIHFFKYMAKRYDETNQKCKLKMWIPDTIILNDVDLSAIWLYSSADGYVYRTDSFTSRNAAQKFTEGSNDPNELIAVIKKPHYKDMELIGNDTKPILQKDVQLLFSNAMSVKQEITCLQKYIKCQGPMAYICRTIWKKNGQTTAWVITNKLTFQDEGEYAQRCLASASKFKQTNIIQCKGGRFIEETIPYIQNLLLYCRQNMNVEFDELGCDFTKGIDNKWYLLNVRGFKLINPSNQIFTRHITHDEQIPVDYERKQISNLNQQWNFTKTQICKFCELIYPAKELTHQLTLKMLIECDLHLLSRNIELKHLQIRNRINFTHLDSAMLFHKYYVCDSCYQLFMACDELIQLEFKMAQKLGIDVYEKNNIISLTQQDYRVKGPNVIQKQANTIYGNGEYFIKPLDWEMLNEVQIKLMPNLPEIDYGTIPKMKRFRIMIYIKTLSQIPIESQFNQCKYYIYYNFLNQEIKFQLDMKKSIDHSKDVLNIDHVKLFYLFAADRQDINCILSQLRIGLLCNQELIGELECELGDFKSSQVTIKEYLKYFSGIQIKQILSWSTDLSIGLVESQQGNINVERIKLQKQGIIYLPNIDYYCSEPLPQEWMNQFEKRKKHNINQIGNISTSFAISDVSNILDHSRVHQTKYPSRKSCTVQTTVPNKLDQSSILYSELLEYQKDTDKILNFDY